MEAGMLSLHLATKALLGEEVVRPKVLPGNFDFSFHFHDTDKQVGPSAFNCAAQADNQKWTHLAAAADSKAFRHLRGSREGETDTVPRGRVENKELADSASLGVARKHPVGGPEKKENSSNSESNIPRSCEQIENEELEAPQQDILGEWLARGEVQRRPPRTLVEASEQLESTHAEAEPVEPSSKETTRKRRADVSFLTQRLRCRNVLMAYALLDPYNRGYIDVQEAAQIIARIKSFSKHSKHASDVAELLLVMVQDMVPYISSRGVLEKEDFLKQIYLRINADYAGVTPYFCLRSNANPIVHAHRERETYTSLFSRAFYSGDYVPDGVAIQEEAESGDQRSELQVQRGSSPASHPYGQHKVRGNLEDHIRSGQLRSMWTRARIKEEELIKEMEECTFHPVTTSMRRPPKQIFPSRRRMREFVARQNARRHGRPEVVYDLDRTVERSPALPPELDPREKQKFDESRRKKALGTTKQDLAACENFLPQGEACSEAAPASLYTAQGACGQPSQEADKLSVEEADPAVYVIHNGDPPPHASDWGLPLRDDWITQLPTDDSGGEGKGQDGRRMRRGREPSEPKRVCSHEAYVRRERLASSAKKISPKWKQESEVQPPSKGQTQYEVRAPYLVQPERRVHSKLTTLHDYVPDLDVEAGRKLTLKDIPVYYHEALERLMHEQVKGMDKSKIDELVLQKATQISEEVMSMLLEKSAEEK